MEFDQFQAFAADYLDLQCSLSPDLEYYQRLMFYFELHQEKFADQFHHLILKIE